MGAQSVYCLPGSGPTSAALPDDEICLCCAPRCDAGALAPRADSHE